MRSLSTFLCFALFAVTPTHLFAEQQDASPTALQVETYMALGGYEFDKRNFEEGLEFLNEANELLEKSAEFPGNAEKYYELRVGVYHEFAGAYRHLDPGLMKPYIDSAEKIIDFLPENEVLKGKNIHLRGLEARNEGNFEESEEIFRKNIALLEDNPSQESIRQLSNSLYSMGRSMLDRGEVDSSLYYLRQAYHYRKKAFGEDSPEMGLVYGGLGHVYSLGFNFWPEALKNYKKAAKVSAEGLESPDIQYRHFYHLRRKANVLNKLNRHEEAISVLKEVKSFLDEMEVDFAPHMELSLYSSIAQTYRDLENYESALEFLYKEKEIWQENKDAFRPDIRRNILSSFAIAYDQIGDYERAEGYFDDLKSFHKAHYPEDFSGNALYYGNYGTFLKEKGEKEEAYENHQRALDLIDDSNEYLQYYFQSNKVLAEIYLGKEEFDKAISKISHSLRSNYIRTEREEAIYEEPSLSEVFDSEVFLKSLEVKGDIYKGRYEKDQRSDDLQRAVEMYSLVIDLIEDSRSGYLLEEDQLHLTEKFDHVKGKAMAGLQKLYEQKGQAQYKQKAFSITERSKNGIMREEVLKNFALDYADLPDSVLLREGALRSKINQLEREKQESKLANPEEEDLSQYKGDLRSLNQQYSNFINEIEERHPEFYEIRYGEAINDPALIQDYLSREYADRALLSYFYTDSHLHKFVINTDEVLWHTSETPDIDHHIEQFNRSMRGNEPARFFEASHHLYQELIEPLEENLPEKLIVVPHQQLNVLSFDALVKSAPDEAELFNKAHYLVEDYLLTYAFSADLFFKSTEYRASNDYQETIGAFAPWDQETADQGIFTRGGMGALYHSSKEIEQIKDIASAATFKGSYVTKENFLQRAEDFNIIHLATHGRVNSSDPFYSALYFPSEGGGRDSLTVSELYNASINASLVSLGACETGVGEQVSGEGIINLARGFAYSGAPNLIFSHWNIPDKATRDLMSNFYQNLKNGKSRDKSLRKSKLSYLQGADAHQANPYHWAGMSYVGDPANQGALSSDSNWPLWISTGFVLMLLLLGCYRFRGRLGA